MARVLVQPYGSAVHSREMLLRSVRHKVLQRLIEDDALPLLGREQVDRVRDILTALTLAEDMKQFISGAPPGWRVDLLSGCRRGMWSVSVSGNWRITFEEDDGHIDRLNLEDYH